MLQSLIPFSTLLAEEHPPADAMMINFALSPFAVIVIVLLAIALVWVAMNVQAGRADLHAAADQGGHHDSGHPGAGQ